jgi:hypothetical protein
MKLNERLFHEIILFVALISGLIILRFSRTPTGSEWPFWKLGALFLASFIIAFLLLNYRDKKRKRKQHH